LTLKASYGSVLLGIITERHNDGSKNAQSARREAGALAVVTAGRGDDAGNVRVLVFQGLHEGQPAARLEGVDRRVVLVLAPDLAAGATCP